MEKALTLVAENQRLMDKNIQSLVYLATKHGNAIKAHFQDMIEFRKAIEAHSQDMIELRKAIEAWIRGFKNGQN